MLVPASSSLADTRTSAEMVGVFSGMSKRYVSLENSGVLSLISSTAAKRERESRGTRHEAVSEWRETGDVGQYHACRTLSYHSHL